MLRFLDVDVREVTLAVSLLLMGRCDLSVIRGGQLELLRHAARS